MTTKEKFKALSIGHSEVLICYREMGVGRNNRTIYPKVQILSSNGGVSDFYKFSDIYLERGLDSFSPGYGAEFEWAHISDEGSRQPIVGGGMVNISMLSSTACRVKKRLPIRFIDKVVIDRFSLQAELRETTTNEDFRKKYESSSEWESRVEVAWSDRATPEYKYGLIRWDDKPNSLQELRSERVRRKPFGSPDLISMYELQKQRPQITAADIDRCVSRHLRRRKKKLTKREQTFFSMLLSAKKLEAVA